MQSIDRIILLANAANELDLKGQTLMADKADALLEKCVCNDKLNDEEHSLLIELIIPEEQQLDDGRFGINDPMNPVYKAAELMLIADELESMNLHKEAFIVEASFNHKIADLTKYLPPQTVATSLVRIFVHLMQRANISNRQKFMNSIRNGIAKINPVELSNKRNNPTSAIGAAINIIKNLLIGQDLNTVINVLDALKRVI